MWTNKYYPATVCHSIKKLILVLNICAKLRMHALNLNSFVFIKLHRVVIPKTEEERKKSRYTFAYFIAPDSQTVIRPLQSSLISSTVKTMSIKIGDMPEKVADVEVSNSPIITAYEHIMERVKTAYGVKKSSSD